ncbi:MAG: hypothetical protein R3326_06540 [Gemmatimonadota bacterium]|nr:hypothetical protein [Gemmatimonadota bacterium]
MNDSTPDNARRSIEAVLADSTAAWMEVPGVDGTGLGVCDGEPCIVVYVGRRTPEVETRIPSSVEGHRVRTEITGEFRPRTS